LHGPTPRRPAPAFAAVRSCRRRGATCRLRTTGTIQRFTRGRPPALRAHDLTRIFKKDAIPFLERLVDQRPGEILYDLVFADPPYHSRALDRIITLWKEYPFATVLTVEHHADHLLPRGGKKSVLAETICVTTYRGRKSPPTQE
jgi:hypothetical protein